MIKNNSSDLMTNEVFQSIIDALPVFLFWTDTNHTIQACNLAQAKALGFSLPSEVVGLSCREAIENVAEPELTELIYQHHNDIMASKTGQILEYQAKLFDQNGKRYTKEHNYITYKYPLFDKQHSVIGLIGIVTDITELKQTREELIQSKEKIKANKKAKKMFQDIIDALPTLLFWTDTNHALLGNNKIHAQTFGFSSTEEPIGMTMRDVQEATDLDSQLVDLWYEQHSRIMKSKKGEIFEYDIDLPEKDGHRRKCDLLCYKYPLIDDNQNVVGLVGVSLDITESKQIQKNLLKAKKEIRAYKKAEAIFQNIIDALPLLLFWTDTDHVLLGNNLTHAQSFGFKSPEQLINLPMEAGPENVLGKDNEIVKILRQQHDEIIQSGKGKVLEYITSLFDKGGKRHKGEQHFSSYKYPLFDENKNVIGLVGASFDVTELKQMQKKLGHSEERERAHRQAEKMFQDIIDALPVMLFWTDTHHIVLGNNKTHAEKWGFSSPDEAVGLSMRKIGKMKNIDPKLMDKFYVDHTEIMRSKQGKTIEYSPMLYDENHHKKRTSIISQKYPLFNNNNEVIGLIGISTDITELKKTQKALTEVNKRAEKIFQSIIDALPLMVFWTNTNHIYLGNNISHAKNFGFSSSDQIVGLSLGEGIEKTLDSKLIELIYQQHDEIVTSKKGQILEYNVMLFNEKKRKQRYDYISYKYPLFDNNDEVIGLIGISADITELKNTQKDLEKANKKVKAASSAKSEFIANMSHDIRTPITGIVGMVQDLFNNAGNAEHTLQESGQLSVKQQKSFTATVKNNSSFLINATNELLQLCNEVLETVNLESGKITEQESAFSLRELANHNIGLLQPAAQHRQIKLSAEIADNVPLYLRGLRDYLNRSMLNLLSNALKFTEQGFVKLAVLSLKPTTSQKKGSLVILQIIVEDSGIGIPEDKFETIFDTFSRLTPSYEGIYKGSGLGLHTVKQYINAMKGSIKVESEVGKGTKFIMQIPFTVSDHCDFKKPAIQLDTLPQHPDITLASDELAAEEAACHLLVVEDNRPAAMALKIALRPFSCAIDIAKNAQQAIEKVQQNHYDLIFMDVGLPDMSGLEATKKIRALPDTDMAQVPIIALTGHVNKKDECLAAGMQDLIIKPATSTTLKPILQHYTNCSVNATDSRNKKSEIIAPILNKNNNLLALDWLGCIEKCQGDLKHTQQLLTMCADDLKSTRPLLKQAYHDNDMTTLREILHSCLGGVCYLQLPQLEQTLKAFQDAVKTETPDAELLAFTYSALESAFDIFYQVLAQTLPAIKEPD
ncbi:MAG: PAS domain-containing protein [Gammaproteobacteria bacterium]|nr:PAS domain-containing protein [Gammaproteobacteria bacterium]